MDRAAPSAGLQHQTKKNSAKSYRVEIRPGWTIDLFIVFSVIFVLLLSWLGLRYQSANQPGNASVLGLTAVVLLVNIFLHSRWTTQSVLNFQFIIFAIVGWTFLHGGIDTNGWFWLIPYTYITFFLQGHVGGQRWNSAMAIFVLTVSILSGLGLINLPYPAGTTLTYLVIYFFMLLLALFSSIQSSHQIKKINEEMVHERSLEKDYEKFKLAVDQVSEHIVITDPDGIIIYANQAIEDATGFGLAETLGKKAGAKELWGGQMDKDFYNRLWRRIKHDKKTFVGEIRNRRKDGTIYHSRTTISPVLDQQKNILFFVGIDKDISDEKKLESILARDEAILFNIGDGLVATDKEGKVTVMNRAAEWLLGKSQAALIGQVFVEAIPAQDANHQPIPSNGRITTQFVTGKLPAAAVPPRVKQYFRRNDGTWFPVITTVAPIVVGDRVDGAVSVFHDVSREEAIEKTKTEFISVASHQLQTPLSAIGWLTELLQDNVAGKMTARQKDVISKIDQSNQRMIEIVNSLLNSSRAELGSFIITPEMTNLVALIQDVVAEVKVKPAHRVTIIEDYHPNFPTVPIDPLLFRMVVQNLLTNALRYTPDDGRITVRLTHDQRDITLEVSDTGIGIPPGSQELIYMKFYRAPNAARLQPQGIGLGMFLVKSIIDAAGGTITFTSVENKGTTFQVRFPLAGMKEKTGIRHLTLSGAPEGST